MSLLQCSSLQNYTWKTVKILLNYRTIVSISMQIYYIFIYILIRIRACFVFSNMNMYTNIRDYVPQKHPPLNHTTDGLLPLKKSTNHHPMDIHGAPIMDQSQAAQERFCQQHLWDIAPKVHCFKTCGCQGHQRRQDLCFLLSERKNARTGKVVWTKHLTQIIDLTCYRIDINLKLVLGISLLKKFCFLRVLDCLL